MVVAAAASLEAFDHRRRPELQHSRVQPALLMMLTGLTVEEMASRDAPEIMDANFSNFIRAMEASGLGNQSTGRTPAIREKIALKKPLRRLHNSPRSHN